MHQEPWDPPTSIERVCWRCKVIWKIYNTWLAIDSQIRSYFYTYIKKFSLNSKHSESFRLLRLLEMNSCLKRWSKCYYLLQQDIYAKRDFQNLAIMMMKHRSRRIIQSELRVSLWKNITKNWQFVPGKANTSPSLSIITQCKCDFDKVFLINFLTIYIELLKISRLFIWGWTRFHFYLYGGPRDFTFIYMVVHEISLLLM